MKYKQLIIGIIIGVMIATGIGAVAYSYTAKQVSFTPNDKEWNVNNVNDALTDLRNNKIDSYEDKIKELQDKVNKYDSISTILYNDNSTTTTNMLSISLITKYKYFKVSNLKKENNVSDCYVAGWSSAQSKFIDLQLDTTYNIRSNSDGYQFSSVSLNSNSIKNNNGSRCTVTVTFFN